jgi:hypothetical protein
MSLSQSRQFISFPENVLYEILTRLDPSDILSFPSVMIPTRLWNQLIKHFYLIDDSSLDGLTVFKMMVDHQNETFKNIKRTNGLIIVVPVRMDDSDYDLDYVFEDSWCFTDFYSAYREIEKHQFKESRNFLEMLNVDRDIIKSWKDLTISQILKSIVDNEGDTQTLPNSMVSAHIKDDLEFFLNEGIEILEGEKGWERLMNEISKGGKHFQISGYDFIYFINILNK